MLLQTMEKAIAGVVVMNVLSTSEDALVSSFDGLLGRAVVSERTQGEGMTESDTRFAFGCPSYSLQHLHGLGRGEQGLHGAVCEHEG